MHTFSRLSIIRALFLFGGLVVLVFYAIPDSFAYTAGAKWPGERANYVFDSAYNQLGPGFNARGQAAIGQWNGVGNSDLFRFATTGPGDNQITVDPDGTCTKLATTYLSATPTTISQFSTKIHVNCGYGFYDGTQPYFPSNYYDLETLMRHEFGHALGLCHTNVGNLMKSFLPTGLVRQIDADAKYGDRYLYKAGYSGPQPEGVCFF